jgi:hypothetical protein
MTDSYRTQQTRNAVRELKEPDCRCFGVQPDSPVGRENGAHGARNVVGELTQKRCSNPESRIDIVGYRYLKNFEFLLDIFVSSGIQVMNLTGDPHIDH